jgi:hypothetical protein
MLQVQGNKGVKSCDGVTRRDFLRAGALGAGAVGLSLVDLARLQAGGGKDVNCILLFLVGGPSQLDTWDLKPNAPDTVRGPFRPVRTRVPGVQICEHFPLMASMADRFAIVRSVHHTSAPIHETGHQLMQTGRLAHGDHEYPHYGAVLSHLRGPRAAGVPPFVVLPSTIGHTGVSVGHGQTAGFLGPRHEPFVLRGDPARPLGGRALADAADEVKRAVDELVDRDCLDEAERQACNQVLAPGARQAFDLDGEPEGLRSRYGQNTFGQSCLLARRLIEQGVRLVTVNMFDTVFHQVTWDCHADGGALGTTLEDYQRILCPIFDRAYTALLDDLAQRGQLENTLVVAMGEFGRTPLLNARGGRDHWPGVWSVLFAGGGVRGGQVIGSSDATASEPRDRPVTPAMAAASIYRALGVEASQRLVGPDGISLPLIEAAPIEELFGG